MEMGLSAFFCLKERACHNFPNKAPRPLLPYGAGRRLRVCGACGRPAEGQRDNE